MSDATKNPENGVVVPGCRVLHGFSHMTKRSAKIRKVPADGQLNIMGKQLKKLVKSDYKGGLHLELLTQMHA